MERLLTGTTMMSRLDKMFIDVVLLNILVIFVTRIEENY